jgi:hypothetical protein
VREARVSIVAAALRELMALGVTGEALVAAVERIELAATQERADSLERAVEVAAQKEDAKLAARKAKAAERTRKWRAGRDAESVTVTSPSVTGRHRDGQGAPATCTGAQVVIPSLPSLRSEEVGGVGGGTREADDWPEGRASDHAERLIADLASPWLDPSKSPDLVTTRGRLAAWRRDGASWEHDVVPVVTALCANRRSKIGTWKFFDAAIARSIAENRAALEIPAAGQLRQTGPPSITDRIAAENAEARRRAFEMLDAQDGPKN